jgi:hypothetical protein
MSNNRVLPMVEESTTNIFMEANQDDLSDVSPWLSKIKRENPCIDVIIREHARILNERGLPEDLIAQYLTGISLIYMLLDAQAVMDEMKT